MFVHQVFAVEPQGKNLSECLQSRERLWPNPPQFLNTIAEGIMTQQVRAVFLKSGLSVSMPGACLGWTTHLPYPV